MTDPAIESPLDIPPLVVVTGPPCAGKSHYVDTHRAEEDLVIDLDRIAHALGYPTEQIDYERPHPARDFAMIARASLLKRIPVRGTTTWVIVTSPDLAHWERRGARIIQLDPGADECHARAVHRARSTHEQIDRWYTEHGTTRQW